MSRSDQASYDGSPAAPLAVLLERWQEQLAAGGFRVERVPLADLCSWDIDAGSGNLVHDTGRFFSVEGLAVHSDDPYFGDWSQPIIRQPEIGLLGIVVKRFGGVLHCLMQAKMEPGNINGLQLSPTVQATRSNYCRVHKGAPTKYLEHFVGPNRATVVADVLQSEQGSWFYRKRNRNMVVEVTEEVELHPGFAWLRLDQIAELMQIDDFVNMDSRTVLSCLTVTDHTPWLGEQADTFTTSLARSFEAHGEAGSDIVDLLSWFTDSKVAHDVSATPVPLNAVEHWNAGEMAICHETGRYFEVVGVDVQAGTREVASWSQPLIAPCAIGKVVFFARETGGQVELLLNARVEAGCRDVAELGPTIQCTEENYADVPLEHRPRYLDVLEALPPEAIRFDTLQSEEGGRFYHAQNRYMVVEVGPGVPVEVAEDFRWIPVGQVAELLHHSHYVNVQARSLIAVLRSMCWRA